MYLLTVSWQELSVSMGDLVAGHGNCDMDQDSGDQLTIYLLLLVKHLGQIFINTAKIYIERTTFTKNQRIDF